MCTARGHSNAHGGDHRRTADADNGAFGKRRVNAAADLNSAADLNPGPERISGTDRARLGDDARTRRVLRGR